MKINKVKKVICELREDGFYDNEVFFDVYDKENDLIFPASLHYLSGELFSKEALAIRDENNNLFTFVIDKE